MTPKNLGVHKITSAPHLASYFIQRNYGNYLFHPLKEDVPYDFFKSKGGIYKQFLNHPGLINDVSKKLFLVYGASAVFSESLPYQDGIKLEKFGDDFEDGGLTPLMVGEGLWFLLRQRERLLLLPCENLLLDHGEWKIQSESIKEGLGKLLDCEVDFVLFRYFLGPTSVVPPTPQVFRQKLLSMLKS